MQGFVEGSFQLLPPAGPSMVSTKCVASDRVQLWQGGLGNQQSRGLAQHLGWLGKGSCLWSVSASFAVSPLESIQDLPSCLSHSLPEARRSVAISASLSLVTIQTLTKLSSPLDPR